MSMDMGKQFTSNPKRKFRWTIEVEGAEGLTWYAKTFARPSLTIEETELNFRHEKMWIAGKPSWESVSLVVLDVQEDDAIYNWIHDVYQFSEGGKTMGFDADGYKKVVTLKMLDAKGSPVETWKLENAWPSTANWGDLDYSASDTADVECTIRFDRASKS